MITAPHDHPALTPALRWMANMLCLWGMCARPACRRARACRSEPRECLHRYAPLVPEEAREGVEALLEGRHYGLWYGEVREHAPGPVEAVEQWMALIEESSRKPAA